MLSCDTMALSAPYFEGGANVLMKNSDRPMGEAQPLFFAPRKKHAPGELCVMTAGFSIPEAPETWAVLGAKPYWIWGFETGVNEFGVVIGNEAQGSRMPKETEEGILGMDLLRLALERAKTAEEAVGVITALLEKYGQNANASLLFDRRYENSYLIADPSEIWLLETAGRQWAAKKVPDWTAISNCYTIGGQFDRASAQLLACAKEGRFQSPHERFHFAAAYTLPAQRQRQAVPRWRRLRSLADGLMKENGGRLSAEDLKYIFRDHFDGEITAPRFGASSAAFACICMHPQDMTESRTVSSFLAAVTKDGIRIRYAAGLPCTSVYLPVVFTGSLPGALTKGGACFSEDSLWWQMERLGMDVTADEARYGEMTRIRLARLEDELEKKAAALEKGEPDGASGTVEEGRIALMKEAAEKALRLAAELSARIEEDIRKGGGLSGPQAELLRAYAEKTGLPMNGL